MAGIFKAYDIRGIVGDQLTPEIAYLIGRGLAAEVFDGPGVIVVSRDMRLHSPELADRLVRGLRDGGRDVVDLGLAATPMNYWGNNRYQAAGSVTVTASHNGAEYNGFKVSGRTATPVDFGGGLDRVERYVASAPGTPALAEAGSLVSPDRVLEEYLDFMDGFISSSGRGLRIGVDAANGMAGLFLKAFFSRHPSITAMPLYWDLDGAFPNHEADPLKPENLLDLQRLVVEEECDFGVAFDGDADRCMFVDDKGVSISSDLITALIAEATLARHPGAPILYDLRSSKVVPEWIAEHGGVPVRGRVGHSFMKRLLLQQGSPFGGELSGHYYFRSCFNTDSGLMAMIELINIWQASGRPLSETVAPLRRYSSSGEINFRVADVASILTRIESTYAEQGAAVDHLDGLTVDLGEWWFNLRCSNTEPLLRLNLEAANAPARDARMEQVRRLIEAQEGKD